MKQPLPHWVTEGEIVHRPRWWLRILITVVITLMVVAACQGK